MIYYKYRVEINSTLYFFKMKGRKVMITFIEPSLENAYGMIFIYDENQYSKVATILLDENDLAAMYNSTDGYHLMIGKCIKEYIQYFHINCDISDFESPIGLLIPFIKSTLWQNERDAEYFGLYIAEGCKSASINGIARKYIGNYVNRNILSDAYRKYVEDVHRAKQKITILGDSEYYRVNRNVFNELHILDMSDNDTFESITKQLDHAEKRAKYLRSLRFSDFDKE